MVLGALLAMLDDPDARCRAQVCAAIAGVYVCPVYMYNLLYDASAATAVAPQQSASHSGDKVPLAGLAGFAGLVRRLAGEAVDTGIVEP